MAKLDYLPVGCFGKLPCYPDYLEANNSYRTSIALRQWLRAGHQRLRHVEDSEDGEITLGGRSRRGHGDAPRPEPEPAPVDVVTAPAPAETSSVRLLLGIPGSVELLVAVVRPSADLGHRRAFPFAVFTHIPRRAYGRHYALLPLGLSAVWEALDDAFENLAALDTRAGFDELLPALLVPPPLPLAEARTSAERLRGESADGIFDRQDGDRLQNLKANLPSVVHAVRKDLRVRVELPVSSALDAAGQDTSFWIELLNRQFLWKRHEPTVFLDEQRGGRGRHVLLAFGPLDDADYPLVMRGEGEAHRPARSSETTPAELTNSNQVIRYADLWSLAGRP